MVLFNIGTSISMFMVIYHVQHFKWSQTCNLNKHTVWQRRSAIWFAMVQASGRTAVWMSQLPGPKYSKIFDYQFRVTHSNPKRMFLKKTWASTLSYFITILIGFFLFYCFGVRCLICWNPNDHLTNRWLSMVVRFLDQISAYVPRSLRGITLLRENILI